MGTDRHYKPGSFYRIDDRTGFAQRAERTRMEWTGLIVDRNVYEARQPQDFVRGVVDDQTVPMPRPRQPNLYYQLATTAQFMVYNAPGSKQFLVMNNNSNIAYDAGINADSGYTNPSGTGEFQVFHGTLPAVTADSFPSNIT